MPPRRPSRTARALVGAMLVMLPLLALVLGWAMMMPFFAMPALMLAPGLLSSPRGEPEGGEDEGGGGGPPRPEPEPKRPWGGTPLPDAEPGRVRVRDHAQRRVVERVRRGHPATPRRPRQPTRTAEE